MPKKIITPFSFEEIEKISEVTIKKPYFIQATDKVGLAYNPFSLVIFYHGGGMYSNKSYQFSSLELYLLYLLSSF